MSKKKHLQYQALPGTHRQRNRARLLLKCTAIKGGWLITGGENEHIVTPTQDKFICDCNVYLIENKLCSHVIKVQMELGIFPTQPELVMK
jgi:hypothetical protein